MTQPKTFARFLLLASFTVLVAVGFADDRASSGTTSDETHLIEIRGSTTAAPIARAFARAHTEEHAHVRVNISATGTEAGVQALIAGECDIAMMSRFMKPSEFREAVENGVSPVFHPLVTDAIAVIVHPDNPVNNLTLEQIRGIYTGSITNWSGVGGQDRRITVLDRETASGTRDVFHSIALSGENADGRVVDGNTEMREIAAGDPGAIGYVGAGFLEDVHIVSIEGAAPTFRTINDGTYPLTRPLFMVTDGYPETGSHIHHLVSMHSTERGRKIVAGMGWYDSWVGLMKGHDTDPEAHVARLGVLAKRGKARCRRKWGATAGYLSRTIAGYRFELMPLDFDEVFPAVRDGTIDFVLANPSYYVQMAKLHGIGRLATLKNLRQGEGYEEFGGVIFCRADRADLQSLQDLAGSTFMAVDRNSFGGWQMAWFEMKSHGFAPHEELARLEFGGTHDAVVHAVLEGRVDAGTVRTGTLERMASEGEIDLDDVQVLDKHTDTDAFPFRHSTNHYPEWPMAAVPGTAEDLASRVAAALLAMPPESEVAKAAKCAGWTVPLNYQPVRECLQALRIGPYAAYGQVTWREAVAEYWPFITGGLVLLAAAVLTAVYVSRLNAELRNTLAEKEREVVERERAERARARSEEKFKEIFNNANDAIYLHKLTENGRPGQFIEVNHVATEMLGYSRSEFLNMSPADIDADDCADDVSEAVSKMLEEGQVTLDIEHVAKDGSRVPVEINSHVFKMGGERRILSVARDISDRKRAEKALRTRDRALESSLNGISITNLQGEITWVNPAAVSMWGYEDRSEVVGAPAGQFWSSREEARRAFCTTRERGEWAGELRAKRRDGSTFPVQVALSLVTDEESNATHTVGFFHDITERKRAEERYRILFEGSRDAILTLKPPSWEFRRSNPAALSLFGMNDESELTGLSPADLSPETQPDGTPSMEKAKEFIDRAMEEGSHFFEWKHKRLDGEEFDASVLLTRMMIGGETVVQATVRDITDQKEAERERALAARQWQVTFDAISDVVFMIDENRRVLRANKAARELADGPIEGRHCYELIHGTDRPPEGCSTCDVFRVEEPMRNELQEPHLGNRWLEMCGFPIENEDGEVTQAVHVIRDITERKRDQERLEDLNSRLKRSNQDLQEFTYTVSHDLQAPLRKIYTFGQFLEEDCADELPEEGLDHLHRMQGAAVRMKELIQHLLKLSRVKTQGAELAPVEPQDVLDEVKEDLSEQIADCNGEVTVENHLPTVMADEVQLRQVFQNLISNALKFRSPDRQPEVRVSAESNGSCATFKVADNGIGIEADYREKIFGIFKRLHHREEYEGAGVGLALCAKIVRRHGGRIWVESEAGEGSEFCFTLEKA